MLASGCKHDAGESCASAQECKEGLICHKDLCFKPRAAGGKCAEAAECVNGLSCYKESCFKPLAVGKACQDLAQCVDGLRCYNERCFQPLGQGKACKDQDQCAAKLECYADRCLTAPEVKKEKAALVDAAMAGVKEVKASCGTSFEKAFKRWEYHMKRASRLLDSVDPGTMTYADRDRLDQASTEQWRADRIMRRLDRSTKKAGAAFRKLRLENSLVQAFALPWIEGTWDANKKTMLKKLPEDKARKKVESLVDEKWGRTICEDNLKKDAFKRRLESLAG